MTTYQTIKANTCCTVGDNLERVLLVDQQNVNNEDKTLIGVAWACTKCGFVNTSLDGSVNYLTDNGILVNLANFEHSNFLEKELQRLAAAAKITKIIFNNVEPTDLIKNLVSKLNLTIISKSDYTPIATQEH